MKIQNYAEAVLNIKLPFKKESRKNLHRQNQAILKQVKNIAALKSTF